AEDLLANAEELEVQAVQRDAAGVIASWIKRHKRPSKAGGHIYHSLLDELESAHASTVAAAVRREGEWQSFSYSHQLGHGARRQAVAALRKSVDGFTEQCDTLADRFPEASELLSQGSRLMSDAYQELLRKMQVTGQTLYQDRFEQDSR